MARVRDEHLRSVDHVFVALAHGGGLDPRHVRAGARLRQPEAAENRGLERAARATASSARPCRRSGSGLLRGRSRRSTCRSRSSPSSAPRRRAFRRSTAARALRAISGRCRFIRPISCALAMMSVACVWCSSHSAALGLISFSANSRARARSSRCSAVRANETPPATPVSTVAMIALLLEDAVFRLTSQSISVDGDAGAGSTPARAPRSTDVAGLALARRRAAPQAAPGRRFVEPCNRASVGRCSGRTEPARPRC